MNSEDKILDSMKGVAVIQRAKDEWFLWRICKYFKPGQILEIGSGCGQIAAILASRGYKVVSSDIVPLLVDHLKSIGLEAHVIDATDILSHTSRTFENILAQGLSTLISTDLSLVKKTYQSVYDALCVGGRFIFIFPNAYRSSAYSVIDDHHEISRSVGFRTICIFRDQVLPSAMYPIFGKKIANIFDRTLGRHFGARHVIVLEKPGVT